MNNRIKLFYVFVGIVLIGNIIGYFAPDPKKARIVYLVKELKSKNFKNRTVAAEELVVFGDTSCVKPLIVCLNDSSSEVSASAIESLMDLPVKLTSSRRFILTSVRRSKLTTYFQY